MTAYDVISILVSIIGAIGVTVIAYALFGKHARHRA